MPPATTSYPYVGTNPAQGRTMITVAGGVDRATSAASHMDVVGFGYSNASSSVRCVNVGEVWAVEIEPASPVVSAAGVKMMVTTDGYHKAFSPGDTGLCAGESHAWPVDVPPASRNYTFTANGKRYVWILSAPSTVA